MIDWPANLPTPQFGLQYNVTDPQMRTRFLSGRSISRRRFSDVPTEFQARWVLTTAEAIEFDRFYQDDMIDGAEWAKMPLVTAEGQTLNFVRFRGGYSSRKIGPELWEYTANMQMYLRPASGIDPPNIGGDPGPGPEPEFEPYLKFVGNGGFSINTANNSKNWPGTLETSTDDETWTTWNGESVSAGLDNILYMRGTGNTYISNGSAQSFQITGSASEVSIMGNVDGLLDYTQTQSGVEPSRASYCFADLFRDSAKIIKSPALPAKNITEGCYYEMFRGCTSLVNAPALPAKNIAQGCYWDMFRGCTFLVNAPALPATTLSDSCYRQMFRDCTSLVNAPALPATTLDRYCYATMFRGCTSLVNAPVLPVTNITEGCYYEMFWGCTSLVNAPVLPATTLFLYCYTSMLYGCTNIRISQNSNSTYPYQWRIPASGTITSAPAGFNTNMLSQTGGSFTGPPLINTTYWSAYPPK